jgi:hypothetical protein
MKAPSSSCTSQAARKQQALVVLLVQQLIDTQFVRADRNGSGRLWQEVAALEIDPERVIHLLYGGLEGGDRVGLMQQDDAWLQKQPATSQRGWGLSRLHLGRQPRRPQPAGISRA